MLVKQDVYSLSPPYRDEGTYIRPVTPGLEPPRGFAGVPGYIERVRAVRSGRLDPLWGTEYSLDDSGLPSDIVLASPEQEAVSEALRRVLIDCGVGGVSYYPIQVKGEIPMYLLGIRGEAGIDPVEMKLRLIDGAEIGVYNHATTCVSPRVAQRIQAANLDVDLDRVEIAFGYPGT